MPRIPALVLASLMAVASHAAVSAQRPGADPVALARQGSAALDEKRYADALEAFTQAAKLLPRDASLCLGAGVAAFLLGQSDEAEEWLQRALKLDPGYWQAAQWLGELQYRDGRLRDAIATYEAVLKRAPNAQGLEERLAAWRKEGALQDRFYESRGAHFSVLFEGPADEALARRVVEMLEAAYWRVGAVLMAYPVKPITVVLYTQQQFQDITRSPAWAGAAYDGRIRVPMVGAFEHMPELDRVLTHEYVHAAVATMGVRNVPVWLNEGLASVFEADGVERAERLLARTSARPRLERLHGNFSGLSGNDAAFAYAYSTHAVQKMIDLRGAFAVVQLLEDLARGQDFADAFQQRLAMRYDEFQDMVAR